MTPEAQQRAIQMETGLMTEGWSPTYADPDNSGGHPEAEPYDFLNDLNAMHEASLTLQARDLHKYCRRLCEIKGSNKGTTASSAQRAEAFLKTLNLWEESK